MRSSSKILITGGTGLVGTNLTNYLLDSGYTNIKSIGSSVCDLTDPIKTSDFFADYKPDYVFHLAGYVNGIMGNLKNKGKAFYLNSLMNLNVIEACRKSKVKKIVAMGTGAVYPKNIEDRLLCETDVWDGEPHDSENAYAHAKRAMLAHLNSYKESYDLDFAYVISANLYGPYDNFDIENGHVVPSLVQKFYDAVERKSPVIVWGNGTARRDFIHAKDAARALELIMKHSNGAINLASGEVFSIQELVSYLSDIFGVRDIIWDSSKPNGQKYRGYNLDKLTSIGFEPKYSLESGLKDTYDWLKMSYKESIKQ